MKKRRGYFKHFNDAYQGTSISNALADRKYFIIHVFWVILGRANQLDTDTFTEKLSYFQQVLRVTRTKVVRDLTETQTYFDCISIEFQSDSVQITVLNYTEYQENRGGKRGQTPRKNVFKNAPIKDKRLKIKDKRLNTTNVVTTPAVKTTEVVSRQSSRFDALNIQDVLFRVPVPTQERWIALYPDSEWMKRTLIRAIGWYMDNGNKKPKSVKGWCQALSSWLERDWVKHARFEKGNDSISGMDWDKIFGGKDASSGI